MKLSLTRIIHDVKRLELGSVNPSPVHKIERTGATTVMLDGDDGLGADFGLLLPLLTFAD